MTKKIAISLPDEHVEAARRAVAAGSAPSVSAYVRQLIEDRQRQEGLAALVADMIATDGTPSPEDYAWAERVLAGR